MNGRTKKAPGLRAQAQGAGDHQATGSTAAKLQDASDIGYAAPGEVARLWAEEQVTALLEERPDSATPAPDYGSLDWLQLEPADPRRAAAVIVAAELWRRHRDEQARLDHLAEYDPDRWFREVTEDADTHASRLGRPLAAQFERVERARRFRTWGPVHQLKPTKGWERIAVPGKPGEYLTYSETRNAA